MRADGVILAAIGEGDFGSLPMILPNSVFSDPTHGKFMKTRQLASFPWSSPGLLIGLCVAALGGCAAPRPQLDPALLAQRLPPAESPQVQPYRVGCPDVLAVAIEEEGTSQGRLLPIGPDGRIELENAGRLRVEGQTPDEVAQTIAWRLGTAARRVQVQVADYQSQKIYICGESNGLQRAAPYRGPETVVELLQRVGGIGTGADPNEVYVIRPRVADGEKPEVFTVQLHDILIKRDTRTNVTLAPFDQVCIGESPQSTFGKCVPPYLKPLYDRCCGIFRTAAARPGS